MGARVLNLIGWLLLATAAVIVGYAIYGISRNFNGYYVGAEKGFAWIIGAFLVAIAVPIGLLGRSLSRQGRETSETSKLAGRIALAAGLLLLVGAFSYGYFTGGP